jgi:hypothetical protein
MGAYARLDLIPAARSLAKPLHAPFWAKESYFLPCLIVAAYCPLQFAVATIFSSDWSPCSLFLTGPARLIFYQDNRLQLFFELPAPRSARIQSRLNFGHSSKEHYTNAAALLAAYTKIRTCCPVQGFPDSSTITSAEIDHPRRL